MSHFTEAFRLTGIATVFAPCIIPSRSLLWVADRRLHVAQRARASQTWFQQRVSGYSIGLPSISCRYRSGTFCEA
jgi:hypothetical protein